MVLRLGKLHWSVGEFEPSIRYREELVTIYEANGQPADAAMFALAVANTYDEKLNRPADAALCYRRALSLNEHGGQLDTAELRSRLSRCESRPRSARGGLWDTLLEHEASPDSAARTAARLAMAVDFNLWKFEPRSFGAWYERVFGGTVSYPASGDSELPIWPFAAIHQLVELARSARELHRHEDSLHHAGTAERLARAFGIAQGQYLAAQASAATCAELGRVNLEIGHYTHAQTIKGEFEATAKAQGLKTIEAGDKILEPWNLIGLLLALNVPKIPDLSTRHGIVKGRLVNEFFMSPAARQKPA